MQGSRAHIFFVLLLIIFPAHSVVVISNEGEQTVKRSQFPYGFIFGAASSAYQIEGGYLEDGKGVNNWDVFTHIPGNIYNNSNGDIADDHYHRFLEDINMMHSLGINSYRFSISWARILPRGRFGKINLDGIAFYNKIIDNLLQRGIEPFVTIHHFDIPQELERRYRSWLDPSIRDDFVYFAKTCFQSFGDRVKHWITINEPNVYVDMGYLKGLYPPGRCSAPFGNCSAGNSDTEPIIAMHNLILSHAKAVKLYRKEFQPKQGGLIGITANTCMFEPLRDNELDRQAVNRALAYLVAWMLDPLVHGEYPPEMIEYLGNELPLFSQEEAEYVKGSLDFVGINYYSTMYVKDCTQSACTLGCDHPIQGLLYMTGERDGIPIGDPTGMEMFFVVPRGLEKIIKYVRERYNNIPMFVTENGYSPPAQRNSEDLLEDTDRIKFHEEHIAAMARAMRNGADVRGYFIWSLMDNFEWIEGYRVTFGLYYVDYQTLERKPKLSARWLKKFLGNCSFNNVEHFYRGLSDNVVITTPLEEILEI